MNVAGRGGEGGEWGKRKEDRNNDDNTARWDLIADCLGLVANMLIVTDELKESARVFGSWRKMLSRSVVTMQDVARIYNHVIQNVRHRRGSHTKVGLMHFRRKAFPSQPCLGHPPHYVLYYLHASFMAKGTLNLLEGLLSTLAITCKIYLVKGSPC